MPNAKACALLEEGKISGYGVIRKTRMGHKIAPLFADNAVIAENLLLSLAKNAGSETLFIDIPDTNQECAQMKEKYSMKEIYAVNRMYSSGIPDLPIEKIFGITSFELG